MSNPTNPGANDAAHEPSQARDALAAHRWAVRVNLPTDARHAAQLARRLLDVAAYASLDAPAKVIRAVEVLEGFADVVEVRVSCERAEQQRRGLDDATWQRELEAGR